MKTTYGALEQIAEIALIVFVMLAAWPLDTVRFALLVIALVALYAFASYNAFRDGYVTGYDRAESDRVY